MSFPVPTTLQGQLNASLPNLKLEISYAPNVEVILSDSNVILTWDPVAGATGYKVFASEDPYSFDTEPLTTVNTNTFTLPAMENKRFFKITAIMP